MKTVTSFRFEMYLGLCEVRPFPLSAWFHTIHPPFCLVSDLWIMCKLLGSTQIHAGACMLAKPELPLCFRLRQSTNSGGWFGTTVAPWLFPEHKSTCFLNMKTTSDCSGAIVLVRISCCCEEEMENCYSPSLLSLIFASFRRKSVWRLCICCGSVCSLC